MRPDVRLPKPSAILKDWDGTFFDSLPRVHAAHNLALQSIGHPPVDYATTIRMSAYGQNGAGVVLGLSDAETAAVQKFFDKNFMFFDATHINLMPGAAEFIAAMPVDLPMAVVSNKQGDVLRQEINHLGWQNKISVAIGAFEAAANKPAADPALLALDKLRVPPSKNVWFIGDTHGDILCAQAAGLTAILVTEHAYHGPAPCFHFANLDALLQAYHEATSAAN